MVIQPSTSRKAFVIRSTGEWKAEVVATSAPLTFHVVQKAREQSTRRGASGHEALRAKYGHYQPIARLGMVHLVDSEPDE